MRFFLAVMAILGGCATVQPPSPVSEPAPAPAAATGSAAVASLVTSARADAAAGRLVQAAASLERALRIEPRNARLWHELAQVRLRQRDYAQAASLANRSNTLAGPDAELRAANQRLIDEARGAR